MARLFTTMEAPCPLPTHFHVTDSDIQSNSLDGSIQSVIRTMSSFLPPGFDVQRLFGTFTQSPCDRYPLPLGGHSFHSFCFSKARLFEKSSLPLHAQGHSWFISHGKSAFFIIGSRTS